MGVQHIPIEMGSNEDGGSTGETFWNADDEHCLSYFLGGETVDNGKSPNSTNSVTQTIKQCVEDSSLSTLNHNQIEVPSTPAVQFYTSESLLQKPHRSKSSPTLTSSNLMHGSMHQQVSLQNGIKHGSQPNFYPFTNHQSHASTTALQSNVGSSSSSSSLSSMQGTSSHQSRAHQQYQSTSTHLNLIKKSPISSTTPCSVGEEVMMLPPPPRLAMNSNSATLQQRSNLTQAIPRQQVSHLEWLQRMNQVATVSLLPFSSHNSVQNNISTNQSPHVTHNQDNCTKQPQFLSSLPSVSRPSPTMNNIPPPKQDEIVTPKIPIQGTMQHANILPSLPSNGNITQQHQFFPQSKEVKINPSALVETKERRQRRLARNRESARQSRRRKKQLLYDLGLHVNKLQAQIECERQKQLIVMEKELKQDRERLIKELVNENFDREENTDGVLKHRIQSLIQDGGPNSSARRNAIVFQYDSLREIILPYHKQYLLWLSLKNESFFISAKEKRSKTGKGTGRVSSKYVGDELLAAQRCVAEINAGGSSKSGIACSADDAQRVWPLFCYELGVSLDQEEKLLNAFRRVKEDVKIQNTRRRLSIATIMASRLKNGVLYQSHSATERNANALIEVLTPLQAARFQEWVIANKSRCNTLFGVSNNTNMKESNVGLKTASGCFTCDNSVDLSMSSVCQQLTEALKITRKA